MSVVSKLYILRNLQNFLSKKIKGKFLIIESDDWGVEGLSADQYANLPRDKGLNLNDPYSKFDYLLLDSDLSELYSNLSGYKDSNGRHPVITANFCMANPDYLKIAQNNYTQFHSKSIHTLYEENHEARKRLFEGVHTGLIKPELHGLEHINRNQWLARCRQSESIRALSEQGVSNISFTNRVGKRSDYRASLDVYSEDDYEMNKNCLVEAYHSFCSFFNEKPTSFIAPCYTWSPSDELTLSNLGVKVFQSALYRKTPMLKHLDTYQKKMNWFGKYNKLTGITYSTRNANLEQALVTDSCLVDRALRDVELSFKYGVPAVLSIHRLNFSGFRSIQNRDKTLRILREFFDRLMTAHPDVRFSTSSELL